jgi:hypothetical protein
MSITEEFEKIWLNTYEKVLNQREEIITAFIAKYGIPPDQIIQVEWRKSETETIWFLRPKGTEFKDWYPEEKNVGYLAEDYK